MEVRERLREALGTALGAGAERQAAVRCGAVRCGAVRCGAHRASSHSATQAPKARAMARLRMRPAVRRRRPSRRRAGSTTSVNHLLKARAILDLRILTHAWRSLARCAAASSVTADQRCVRPEEGSEEVRAQ